MAATFEPIATSIAGGSSPTISFTSIPATYTDLYLVITGTVGASDNTMLMQYNGDTTSNYSSLVLSGNGSAAQSFRDSGSQMYCGRISTVQSPNIIQIINYSNTTIYKTFVSRGNSDTRVSAFVGTWRNTAAITTVTITHNAAGNFASGTTATLYGIKAA